MSIKTSNEAQQRADHEALKQAALTNLKRDCARDLVPILRLVKQERWVEASLAVDEYLEKPVAPIIALYPSSARYERLKIFREALKLRGEDPIDVEVALDGGRKLIAIQLEKDENQRLARERAEVKR